MKLAKKNCPALIPSSDAADRSLMSVLRELSKQSKGRGISLEEFARFSSMADEISDRWGESNSLVQDLLHDLWEVEGGKPHTVDHVDCPACRALDDLMKADLLGMADQTFPDAADVWQQVRKNSNFLRERTHESVTFVTLRNITRSAMLSAFNAPGTSAIFGVVRVQPHTAFRSIQSGSFEP